MGLLCNKNLHSTASFMYTIASLCLIEVNAQYAPYPSPRSIRQHCATHAFENDGMVRVVKSLASRGLPVGESTEVKG